MPVHITPVASGTQPAAIRAQINEAKNPSGALFFFMGPGGFQ